MGDEQKAAPSYMTFDPYVSMGLYGQSPHIDSLASLDPGFWDTQLAASGVSGYQHNPMDNYLSMGTGSGVPTTGGWDFSQASVLGGRDANGNMGIGWGSALLDVAKAGMSGWLGMQQLNLAKDNLSFQKDAFSKQFENQRTLTNAELSDRQNARVAATPGTMSTEEYMKAHGV